MMSWISLDDAVGAILHVLMTPSLGGPVNLVSPSPVDNRTFTRTLARVISRPAFVPAPAFAIRTLLGEFAELTLLSSCRAQPKALLETGYNFQYPELEGALSHQLGTADGP